MASISLDPKSQMYRMHFRYGGKQFQKSLKTGDQTEAEGIKGRIAETLRLIERGRVDIPADADLWQFLFSDGKRETKPVVTDMLTLDKLFAHYDEQMSRGTIESNSLDTCRLHQKHLRRLLGAGCAVQTLTVAELQDYVNTRSSESFRNTPINPRTIKKEVATFRGVWNWAVHHRLLAGPAPVAGLRYEKADEKQPFMTWGEIEERVKRGGLNAAEVERLWESLFLEVPQIEKLLTHVEKHATFPFIYPMFVFVAHTGVRRSELCRSRVEDFDFKAKQVRVREKKKDRNVKLTFRQVNMTDLLAQVMKEWFNGEHPGGPFALCQTLATRTKIRAESQPLTRNEATHHFKQTLVGSKWAVVRGFHVFRHSFASNLAARGERQEVIDGFLGHVTEDMRRRYRHLLPREKASAIERLFGSPSSSRRTKS